MKRITARSLSLGFGMNLSRGLDAFAFLISSLVLDRKAY
jgi:hypothetical protein